MNRRGSGTTRRPCGLLGHFVALGLARFEIRFGFCGDVHEKDIYSPDRFQVHLIT